MNFIDTHKNEGHDIAIKELRTATGMTQTEFGNYFNIPMRTIQNWEGGQRNCPEYVIELIKYKLIKEEIV